MEETEIKKSGKKERLEWLDAMRGFTMILVVAFHVSQMGFGLPVKTSSSLPFLLLFRMPLFFFISGFLAYKASFSWNLRDTGALVAKKLRVQIIPTLVFMTAEIALMAKHFWDRMGEAWESPTKGGYWFTMVLLIMFLIYYTFCFFTRKLTALSMGTSEEELAEQRRIEAAVLIIVWAIAVFAYATLYMRWFSWRKEPFFRYSSLTEVARYFQFFLLGNLVHRFWPQVQRLLDTRWFFPLLVVVAFLGAGDYQKWHNLRMEWANLPRTLSMYAFVMMIVAFFRHYEHWFTKETRLGSALQYIGVRTLDIYLIHYFFIPKLPDIGVWFKAHPTNFVLEGTTAIILATLVIAFSLLTSHILRVSPFLKKWLFGRE